MPLATRKVDERSRVVLPEVFAGRTVVIEAVSADEVRVRLVKAKRHRMSFDKLIAQMDANNQPEVIDFGPPTGKEQL